MLTIDPIPAYDDNYIWLISDGSDNAFVVDPGDAAPVLEVLRERKLNLAGILIPHHHFDHVGGLQALRDAFSPMVYGPDNPAIAGLDRVVTAGDEVDVLGRLFTVMAVPGHTLDHIAYYHSGEQPVLFSGDTLFAGGCGRLFEGTPEMMHASLQRLAVLPGNTRVYCAHEYTLANLSFAQAVEPENSALLQRIADAEATRSAGRATVPSTLELEIATNPFLRCDAPELRESLRQQNRLDDDNPVAVFATVRGWKDNF